MCSAVAASRVDEFHAAISRTLDAGQVHRADLSRFAVDGQVPDIAMEPATLAQLQAVLAEASACSMACVAFGGGTHMAAGNSPDGYDAAISLARMARIVEHVPEDLTVTVEAGVTLADLRARLAEHGQMLPLDPPCGDAATVGGVVAANAFGPMRHAYGTARDWLIGIRVVHADGASSKSGGRVVKNVAGYDMHKLYAGSLGTLGVIAEATFKLVPVPRRQATVSAGFESPAAACALIFAAHDAGLALHAAELLSPTTSYVLLGDPRWSVLARVAGGERAVQRTLAELERLAGDAPSPLRRHDGEQPWREWAARFAPGALSIRASVPASHVAETAEVLERAFAGSAAQMSVTVTAGVLRARLEPDRDARAPTLVERARAVAARAGGVAVVDAAPATAKQDLDVFGPLRPDFAIMKRLKEQLDPGRILAPGRFAGRL